MSTGRSIRRLAAIVAALAMVAAACGDDDGGSGEASGETRTVTHAFGEVEVPVDPQRIASVGYEEQQIILHFGKVPVIQRDYTDGQPFGVWPWDIEALGDAEPETFTDDMPYEQIAAAEPDLIMAMNVPLDQEMYDRLSQIAPTVAQNAEYPEGGTPTLTMFTDAAVVFGMEDEAEQMLADADAQLAAAAEAHPEWADLYVGTISTWEVINVDSPDHPRGQLLQRLGFKPITEDVIPLVDGYPTLSFEEVDGLDNLDVGIWMLWEESAAEVLDLELRTSLALHTEGREIVADPARTAALGLLPHQIDYVLPWLVAELEAALDADPSTPVSSAVDWELAPTS